MLSKFRLQIVMVVEDWIFILLQNQNIYKNVSNKHKKMHHCKNLYIKSHMHIKWLIYKVKVWVNVLYTILQFFTDLHETWNTYVLEPTKITVLFTNFSHHCLGFF